MNIYLNGPENTENFDYNLAYQFWKEDTIRGRYFFGTNKLNPSIILININYLFFILELWL